MTASVRDWWELRAPGAYEQPTVGLGARQRRILNFLGLRPDQSFTLSQVAERGKVPYGAHDAARALTSRGLVQVATPAGAVRRIQITPAGLAYLHSPVARP